MLLRQPTSSVRLAYTQSGRGLWPGSCRDQEPNAEYFFFFFKPDCSFQWGVLISSFSSHTDKIHRCNALQSPSVHHRINQWERPRPGGVPASRITHEPQHDRSLLTTPKPVPYSQWKHTPPSHSWINKTGTLSLATNNSATARGWKKTFPTFHQLASRISLRPRPSDIFNVQPGRDWTSGWATPDNSESHDYQARILAGHYRTRRDTIKHSGQFSKATRRPVRDFQPLIKASSSSSTHGNGWSPTPTRRNNLIPNQGCVKAESLLGLVPTSGNHSNSNFF